MCFMITVRQAALRIWLSLAAYMHQILKTGCQLLEEIPEQRVSTFLIYAAPKCFWCIQAEDHTESKSDSKEWGSSGMNT